MVTLTRGNFRRDANGNLYNAFNSIYTAELAGDSVILGKDGKTVKVRVVPDNEFIFKKQKRQIKAKGGASGLYSFFENCIAEHFGESWIFSMVDHYIQA